MKLGRKASTRAPKRRERPVQRRAHVRTSRALSCPLLWGARRPAAPSREREGDRRDPQPLSLSLLNTHTRTQAASSAAPPPASLADKGIAAWRSNTTNPCAAAPKWYPNEDGAKGPQIDLSGRVMVLTGARGGLGSALSAALAAAGVTVLGTSRDPPPGSGLLALDATDPASVSAFAAAVRSHPAVLANSGLDALLHAPGRLVLGAPGNPALPLDPDAWESGLKEGMHMNYLGPMRVTNALWPLLNARASGGGYGRVVFAASPLGWASGSAVPSPYLFGFTATQRALLGYANNLRAGAASCGSKVKLSTVSLMTTDTQIASGTNPIFLQPVDGAGDAVGDPAFQAFLDALRSATAAGMDPAGLPVAAFLQVLREKAPTANVAAGSPAAGQDAVAPSPVPFAAALTQEMLTEAAFTAVPPLKGGVPIISGAPDKAAAAGTRRRLAATLVDDALRWVATKTTPCTPMPFFYPTPGWTAADAAASLTGRVGLVTGASCGIGKALALKLHAAGVNVIGTSRTPAAYASLNLPFPLLALDMASPASVASFQVALASNAAVIARGGLDFAVLNAGRFAAGPPGPPPFLDSDLWYRGVAETMDTNFLGPARVAHVVLPLLEARLTTPDGQKDPFSRLLFTASASAYATGGADPLSMFYWAYAQAKRASLAYYDALRASLEASGSGVAVGSLHPMAVDTRLMEGRRPTFLSPVDAAGWPVRDPAFKAIMALYRDGLSRALAPVFAATADIEMLTQALPLPPDAVVGSWAWKPFDAGRAGGNQDIWDVIAQAELLESAFPFEAGKEGGGEE